MGTTSSTRELFLPSSSSAPSSSLQTRMEGGETIAPLCRSKPVQKCIGRLEDLEANLVQANALAAALGQAIGGLDLSFELKSGVTNRELLQLSFNRVLGSVVVIVHAQTEVHVGIPRVTTPRGFTWLFIALQDLKGAVSSLEKANPVHKREDECPICMDRPVSIALACGHAFCKECEMEWLVGEGRGTCPLCRSQESEHNEWVLNNQDQEARDDDEVVQHAEAVVSRVLTFLSSLPTVSLVVFSFAFSYRSL